MMTFPVGILQRQIIVLFKLEPLGDKLEELERTQWFSIEEWYLIPAAYLSHKMSLLSVILDHS